VIEVGYARADCATDATNMIYCNDLARISESISWEPRLRKPANLRRKRELWKDSELFSAVTKVWYRLKT
jgi:hypothetical protein